MFEFVAVHTDRFGSHHVFMRAVGRAHRKVTSDVRSPTLPKRRTPSARIPRGSEDDYITIEDTGLVGSIQLYIFLEVLHKRIQKLFVLRKFSSSVSTNQFFSLPMGKWLILLGNGYAVEP